MGDLDARVVAVTGGARGIGRAIASELTRAGARVGIGDVDMAAAAATASELGGGVEAFELDVTDRASMETFLDGVEERLGPLDVMVNNAGILLVGPFLEEDDAATERQLAVNVMGVVHGMRAALPRMRERGSGHVVNVASSASWVAPPGEVTYSATKHAVLALTDGVREELHGSAIHVTGVFPGLVATELAKGTKPPRITKWISPEQVGAAVADAIRRPRADVFVTRDLGAAGAAPARDARAPPPPPAHLARHRPRHGHDLRVGARRLHEAHRPRPARRGPRHRARRCLRAHPTTPRARLASARGAPAKHAGPRSMQRIGGVPGRQQARIRRRQTCAGSCRMGSKYQPGTSSSPARSGSSAAR